MAKNEKICIIGAGPAGLSAAVHLEKNGYPRRFIYYPIDNKSILRPVKVPITFLIEISDLFYVIL